jgi:hypothetical protein
MDASSNGRRWQGESWSQFFEDWILELALAAAVFAAIVNSVASLSGF